MLSKLKQILLIVVSVSLVAIPGTAYATGQLVAQGYTASSTLQPGMIVRLDSKGSNSVTALDLRNINKMLGVVVSANESALTIGQSTNSEQVYVSNTGQHSVLVTTQNGPIVTGDYITISDISGIGMKADSNEGLVLGQAAGNFNGSSNVLGNTTVGSGSNKQNVAIGSVPVDINIS